VDSKALNRKLVFRNSERDRAEGGTVILCRISTEVYVDCPQLLQANAGISRIRYDNFMCILRPIFHSNMYDQGFE
jgi:hypothetical protein